MGTETRIGIVAGLLIVVIASVYFFYGNGRRDDDILVATGPKAADLKIPASADPRPSALKKPAVAPTRNSPSPANPLVNPFQPQRPLVPPVNNGSLANSVSTPAGPPADAGATGIDKYRMTGPTTPTGPGAITPTLLRTEASPLLVEATKDNLTPIVKQPEPKASTPTDSPAKTSLSVAPAMRTRLEPDPIVTPSVQTGWPKKHVAVKGDTFANLAKQYYGDAKKSAEIVAANPKLKGRRILKAGEEVVIPELAAPREEAKDSTTPTLVVEASGKTYVVQEGDTFYSIARSQLGDAKRAGELLKLNKELVRGEARRLRPGMTIKLP
ncbi:MAG: LysM peptidoglycan-binding domain-containing protein [Planctomycetes bacterium]|nr:LysM peptidoglycan-binding domain-containing protein [Planctomycetota bacterium]